VVAQHLAQAWDGVAAAYAVPAAPAVHAVQVLRPVVAQLLSQAGDDVAAMVRTTCAVVGVKAGGIADNVLPTSGVVKLNFRLLPGRSLSICARDRSPCAAAEAGSVGGPPWSSLTACRHQALAAVSPPSGASQNAWVYICPQTTKSRYQLVGMHLGPHWVGRSPYTSLWPAPHAVPPGMAAKLPGYASLPLAGLRPAESCLLLPAPRGLGAAVVDALNSPPCLSCLAAFDKVNPSAAAACRGRVKGDQRPRLAWFL
jgi:hypothetical protein